MAALNQIRDILLSLTNLPNAPVISVEVVQEYHSVLGHWPDDVLDMAVLHYKSTETFFPTPGVLNNKVLDMQMLAMGIPTAGEAWSQVLSAIRYFEAVVCDEGRSLNNALEGLTGGHYMSAIADCVRHENSCDVCVKGGYRETYDHPVVAETVRLLGGRDILMTENPAADRKQFIDAYRERVALEGRKFIMPPRIKEFVSLEAGNKIKQLAEGLSK